MLRESLRASLRSHLTAVAILCAACGQAAQQPSTLPQAETAEPAQGGAEPLAEATPAAPAAPLAAESTPPVLTASCLDEVDTASDPQRGLDCLMLVEDWRFFLEQLSMGWRAQAVSRFSSALQPADMAVLGDTFRAHASVEALHAGLREHLSHNLAGLHIDEWLAWYRSPLGSKFRAAMSIRSVPDSDRTWLRDHPPSKKRKKLIQEQLRLGDGERQLQLLLVWPAQAMMQAGAADQAEVFDAAKFARTMQPTVDATLKLARDGFAYMFRELSDAELAEINAFFARPEIRQSCDVYLSAVEAAIGEAAVPLGPPVRAALEQVAALTNAPVDRR